MGKSGRPELGGHVTELCFDYKLDYKGESLLEFEKVFSFLGRCCGGIC